MDLTPRSVQDPAGSSPAAGDAPRSPGKRRPWLAVGLLVAVLAVGGFIVARLLTKSLDYYCDVDQVGRKAGCEGTSPIRLQGSVKEGSRTTVNGAGGAVTEFVITHNHAELPVRYRGVVNNEIFQDCVNVVVHGQLREGVFDSDNVEVKHSNEYQSADDPAVKESKRSAACLQQR